MLQKRHFWQENELLKNTFLLKILFIYGILDNFVINTELSITHKSLHLLNTNLKVNLHSMLCKQTNQLLLHACWFAFIFFNKFNYELQTQIL